jgi:hypothetical protein
MRTSLIFVLCLSLHCHTDDAATPATEDPPLQLDAGSSSDGSLRPSLDGASATLDASEPPIEAGAPDEPCTKTLTVGDNVAASVRGAAPGSTLCLNDGNYGTVDLSDIQRTGRVTIRSFTALKAVLFPRIGNSTNLRLVRLTLNGALQNSCSRNIEWVDNTVQDTITLTNDRCAGSLETRFDGNRFGAIDAGGGSYEGRISLIYGSGITLVSNTFGPGGASDGVFMGGDVSNVTIGPGNVFKGILEANCGAVHCDAIQGYGAGAGIDIKGNLFENGDTFIMMPDGSRGVSVVDNVFNGYGVGYPDKIQFGSAVSPIFRHNTLANVRASFDSKTGEVATTNVIAENNIMTGTSSFKTSNGSGCTGCTFRTNLYPTAASATGTANIVGTPSFVGGGMPSIWSGWKLTVASPGHLAASDGKDMGATMFGP